MSASSTDQQTVERRQGVKDRRVAAVDRRNDERVAEELVPRRNPDYPDRRSINLGKNRG